MADRVGIQAGTQLGGWGILNEYSTFVGSSGNVAAGATGEQMKQFLGIKTASPAPVEGEDVNSTGDDTTLGAISFPANETPAWITEVAAYDFDTDASFQGTSVETLGDIQFSPLQPNNMDQPDIFVFYQGKAKSKYVGRNGIKQWVGILAPLVTATPLGRAEWTERTAGVDRYSMVAQTASKKPWGVTIRDEELGTDGSPLIRFTADYPVWMQVWKGDGVTTAFNFVRTPVSLAKTVIHVVTGPSSSKKAPTTDYTLTGKQLTMIGAPANNALVVALFEFRP